MMKTANNLNKVGKIYRRPWGSYKTLEIADNYQIKILSVNPSGRLSTQRHKKRSEHWVAVRGQPTITVDQKTTILSINDYAFIPQGAIHRIENQTDQTVTIIEVQVGDYLGEDDITRLDDIYGRADRPKNMADSVMPRGSD